MINTLETVGVAGIVAPQIGASHCGGIYFVVEHRVSGQSYEEIIGLTVLVKPELQSVGETAISDWEEGCLSLPNLRCGMPRWERIRLTDEGPGHAHRAHRRRNPCRIVQHEFDHLDGRLCPIRMTDFSGFAFLEELIRSGQLPRARPGRGISFAARMRWSSACRASG
jgi:peptide deformylase